MHSPLLLFHVAIMAELVLTESDQANVAVLVPPTPPDNSPFPIPITPDFDLDSYDSGSMFPVDMNPVTSTPTGALSLDSKIAQEPNNVNMESSIKPAINDANKFDSDHSLSSCDSVSTTTGRKLRRDQAEQCVPRESPGHPGSPVPSQSTVNGFLDQLKLLFGGDSPQTDSPQTDSLQTDNPQTDNPQTDTTQTQKPKGELSEGQMRRIYQIDMAEMQRLLIRPEDPYWQSPEANPCGRRNPDRPRSVCCLGPAYARTRLNKRAVARVVDVENCMPYILIRPFCRSSLGTRGHFCCFKLDFSRRTFRGYMGLDCVPMWLNWRFDGLDPTGTEN